MSISKLKDKYKKKEMQEELDKAGVEYSGDDLKDDLAEIMLEEGVGFEESDESKEEIGGSEESSDDPVESSDDPVESSDDDSKDMGEYAGKTIGTRDRIIEKSREVTVNGRRMIKLWLMPDSDTKTAITKILSRKDVKEQIGE